MATLYHSTAGRGPELVLLHGWGLHAGVWAGVRERLCPHYRVTTIDLPGHGNSPATVALDDLDATCKALHQVAPPRAVWVGWSLGGLLGLAYSERYPQAVTRLIPVAAGPCMVGLDEQGAGLDPTALVGLREHLQRDRRAALKRFLSLQIAADPGPSGRAALKVLRRVLASHQPNAGALQAGLQLLAATNLTGGLAHLCVPVRVLLGAQDRLIPAAAIRASWQHAPDGACSVLPDSGHAPFLDREPLFMAALLEHLHD